MIIEMDSKVEKLERLMSEIKNVSPYEREQIRRKFVIYKGTRARVLYDELITRLTLLKQQKKGFLRRLVGFLFN